MKLNHRLVIEMKPIADRLSNNHIHGYVHVDDLIREWKTRPLTNTKRRTRPPDMKRVTYIMRQMGYVRVKWYVYKPKNDVL